MVRNVDFLSGAKLAVRLGLTEHVVRKAVARGVLTPSVRDMCALGIETIKRKESDSDHLSVWGAEAHNLTRMRGAASPLSAPKAA